MPPAATTGKNEIELLLACCRGDCGPAVADRVRALSQAGLNWDGMLELARRNGVLPQLFAQLKTFAPAEAAGEWFERLRQQAQAISVKNLRLTAEFLRLMGILKAAGIIVLPFKGPALACQAYGNLSLRSFNDLDLILRPEDFPKAREVLREAGYRVRPPFDETPLEALWKSDFNACNFDHPELGITVDAHWTITSEHFAIPFDPAPCWERAVPVTVGGVTVSALSPEDGLVALCAHGYTHSWKKLAWICDLAQLIRSADGLDWDAVLRLARASRMERILFVGLRLAVELLAVELPAEVRRNVEADAAARDLANQVRAWLFNASDTWQTGARKRLFLIAARERWQDRLQVLRHLILTPNERDCAFLRLPPKWWFLLYLVRPVRLAVKSVGRLLP